MVHAPCSERIVSFLYTPCRTTWYKPVKPCFSFLFLFLLILGSSLSLMRLEVRRRIDGSHFQPNWLYVTCLILTLTSLSLVGNTGVYTKVHERSLKTIPCPLDPSPNILEHTGSHASTPLKDGIYKSYSAENSFFNDMSSLKDDIPEVLQREKALSCKRLPAPKLKTQVCCMHSKYAAPQEPFRCIPNSFVIGAQKSGTTALYQYLIFHPEFVHSEKGKELHFFDNLRNYHQGPMKYMSLLPNSTQLQPSPNTAESVALDERNEKNLEREIGTVYKATVDVTPSYLPALGACERIKDLVPEAKLVVMLRDPVKRAWSEILMKLRMEESKEHFFNYVQGEGNNLYNCTKSVVEEAMDDKDDVSVKLEECFLSRDVPEAHHLRLKLMAKKISKLKIKEGWRACFKLNESKWYMMIGKKCGVVRPMMHRERSTVTGDAPQDGGNPVKSRFLGDPKSLNDGRLLTMLKEEAAHLNSCLASNAPHDEDDPVACNTASPVVHSDISQGFLWRGLYYYQLMSCFKSFPKEQFMIIEDNDLIRHPEETLREILNHMDFSYVDLTTTTAEQRQMEFDKRHPEFQEITGWGHKNDHSEHHHMPETIQDFMERFYEPHNKLLFEFLGKVYDWS